MTEAQGYIELDFVDFTEQDWETFNNFIKQYFVNFELIKRVGSREYYSCLIKNYDSLFDTEDAYGILSLIGSRNPVVNGMWYTKGTNGGLPIAMRYEEAKEAVYDAENDEIIKPAVYEIVGEKVFSFDAQKHLKYTPPIPPVYDDTDEGTIITPEQVCTTIKPLHSFCGKAGVQFVQ